MPGVASAGAERPCCVRCGGLVGGKAPEVEKATETDRSAAADDGSPPAPYDGWELDQQLQQIERMLDPAAIDRRRIEDSYRQEAARLDPPHEGLSGWHPAPAGGTAHRDRPKLSQLALAAVTWTALSLGTMAFVCGGILVGWSVVSGRTELWNVGMPIALGGQIALLLGLVLQLDRLWHDSRRAAARLSQVDDRLDELKTTTTLLSTGHSSPGSAFYSHLAGGAGPQVLLSDLKGQLDLLAVQIGEEKR